MPNFWSFAQNPQSPTEYVLRIEDVIASQRSWWGDEVTPKLFAYELAACPGPLTLWIDSPGGDVFAASAIHTMLMEHKRAYGKITVKISGIAASAASLIAMVGDVIEIAPMGFLMIHNPWATISGDRRKLEHLGELLGEIKEGQIDIYEARTGKSRAEIAALMDAETYMNAATAIANGFADGILYQDGELEKPAARARAAIYALATEAAEYLAKARKEPTEPPPAGCPADMAGGFLHAPQSQAPAPKDEETPPGQVPEPTPEPDPEPTQSTDSNHETLGLMALALAEGLE